jgi:hypothetical protein
MEHLQFFGAAFGGDAPGVLASKYLRDIAGT